MEYQWNLYNLLGGLEHFFYDFPYIGNVIIPTDELDDFFKGVGQPPTSWGLLGIVGKCWVLLGSALKPLRERDGRGL